MLPLVLILDDDPSIHRAWNLRFENDAPNLKLKHFDIGQDVIDFIATKTNEEKQNIFLLMDFELLNQKLNGLQVIEQTGIKRSILVTSHYNNKKVLEMAAQNGTKILPKLLAVDIPFEVELDDSLENKQTSEGLKKIDLVLVDDEVKLMTQLKNAFFAGKEVDIWGNPVEFLEKFKQYDPSTRVCLDNNFSGFDNIDGFKIAKELHEAGFTDIYIVSGDKFNIKDVPNYINLIFKTDIDSLSMLCD